jgi:uncharacterized protein (DUF2235 family)
VKNIAIFCDGTWQSFDQPCPTNVAIIARAVLAEDAAGTPQVVHYDDGVGVGEGVLNQLTQAIGGATGAGLDYKIAHAYQFICLNYEPGDRIFIMGFSRGAYTARSLAGLLRWAWILRREKANLAVDAMKLYRTRPSASQAGSPAEAKFEADMRAFRDTNSYPAGEFTGQKTYAAGDASTLAPDDIVGCAWIQYVGVWDTVGSLGVPSIVPLAKELNAPFQFYDTNLSLFVRSARHAVAIDERRKTFAPALWTNIDALNENAGADARPYGERPYQQQWFPGDHGCVGGGGEDGGISLVPMLWIEAEFVKPKFNLINLIVELVGLADRPGPATFEETSLATRLRFSRLKNSHPPYDPKPLRRVEGDLRAFQPASDPQAYFSP